MVCMQPTTVVKRPGARQPRSASADYDCGVGYLLVDVQLFVSRQQGGASGWVPSRVGSRSLADIGRNLQQGSDPVNSAPLWYGAAL